MENSKQKIGEYLKSGVIERYVLGFALDEEIETVEKLAEQFAEINDAIDQFSRQIEETALANAVEPPLTIKPLLVASVDYMERLQKGEPVSYPPILSEKSTVADYAEWLNRPDMTIAPNFKDIQAKLIGHTKEYTTAIVWIKEMAPQEVHDDEFERFLIVEGTCTITISDKEYNLSPGDYLAIPLFEKHHVKVTSAIPCKVILQRIAA